MAQSIPDPSGRAFTTVPWQRGVRWWGQAWEWMFARGHAGVWLGIGVAGLLLVAGVDSLVPRLGSLVSSVLGFVLGGGMATAAHKTRAGVVPRFADMFAGFQGRTGALTWAGLILAVGTAVGFALLFGAFFGGAIGALAAGFDSLDALTEAIGGGLQVIAAGFGIISALSLFAALLLLLVASMAGWLAPALIMLRGLEPIPALRASFASGWANAGALTAYGVVFIGAAIVATVLLGVGWLVLLPLISLSTYAAYVDLFGDGDPPP